MATVVPGLDRRVRRDIYDHVYANDDHEVGGVLIGRLEDGPLPIITASIAALEAEGLRASVTFTHEAWATIHQTMERDFPDDQIVGWYHSHPGFGIFLSNYDRFIHDNFFSDPRQIAYVVDPQAGREGVFHWQDGELVVLWEGAAERQGTGRPTAASATTEDISPLRVRAPGSRADRPGVLGLLAAAAVAVVVVVVALLILSSGGGSKPASATTRTFTTEGARTTGHARTVSPASDAASPQRTSPAVVTTTPAAPAAAAGSVSTANVSSGGVSSTH